MSTSPVDEHDTRILIVDDEKSVRHLFSSCLSNRYSFVTTKDAQEALLKLAMNWK
jgi:CheY-like chemotaxis protein